MRALIHGLFSRLETGPEGDPADDDLLAAYVAARDAHAFEAIVRRHGPMVHGVCRRVLGNEADADDAFQATFLVLVRKADGVRPGSMLGNWLYGVAVNVARKGRELAARRREKEMRAAEHRVRNEPPAADEGLAAVLDQELGRLPAVYRAAVVACDLEGQTRKEAAGRLGWSEGTVASRLARGRALLAGRLTRRGVTVPAAGIAAVTGVAAPVGAAVPPELLRQLAAGTGSATADELAKWAVRAMAAGKLKTALGVVLAVVGVAGIGTAVALAFGPGVGMLLPGGGDEIKTAPPAVTVVKPAEKPAYHVLTNPAKDITVVSDRDETVAEFFRRQKLMVASLAPDRVAALLAAKGPTDRTFVTTASYNELAADATTYGAVVRIAPPVSRATSSAAVSKPVADLLKPPASATGDEARPLWLIFRPDATEPDLWHVVGFTTRAKAAEAGFFTSGEKVAPDEFTPAELIYKLTKKQK